jgi:hypothetical protein
VDALAANSLAQDTTVYFFSDAPRPGDEARVEDLRGYLRTVHGFSKVEIIERSENNRIVNNRGGMKQLLEQYGKMIWLEEDIVTAPGFLAFMNEALAFYESDDEVISISGYSPPIDMPKNYRHEVYLLDRFCAWGFASWRRKFDPWGISNQDIVVTPEITKRLSEAGQDVPKMLNRVLTGDLDALDVKVMYHQALTGTRTLYPTRSLVQNTGHDGTGVHCVRTDKFKHRFLWDKTDTFEFVPNLKPHTEIVRANKRFRDEGLLGKVDRFVDRLGLIR